jgi:hypothetical protein
MPDALTKFVFELVAYGGGAAVIAYLLFQFLGKTWIENKFAQQLKQLEHQQAYLKHGKNSMKHMDSLTRLLLHYRVIRIWIGWILRNVLSFFQYLS